MAQVLRRHLNDIDVADSKKTDIGNSNVHRGKNFNFFYLLSMHYELT